MAEFGFPMESGAGAQVSEDQWGLMSRWWMNPGVYLEYLGGLQVYADSTGRQVKVRTGGAWAYGAMYLNTAELILPIAVNAGATRIDAVVVRFEWASDRVFLFVVAGSPGAGPPILAQTPGVVWDLELARITVATGFITLGGGTVEDRRVNAAPRTHDLFAQHTIHNVGVGYPLRSTTGADSATPNQNFNFGLIGDQALDGTVQRPNLLLNGGFESKVRAASSTNVSGAYLHDGWQLVTYGTDTLTVQDYSATAMPDSQHAAYCTPSVVDGGGNTWYYQQIAVSGAGGAVTPGTQPHLRGKTLSLRGFVWQAAGYNNYVRLSISGDGSGVAGKFSPYHGPTAAWEALDVVGYVVPNDATYVQVIIQFMGPGSAIIVADDFQLVLGAIPGSYIGEPEWDAYRKGAARYQRIPAAGSLYYSGMNAANWPWVLELPFSVPMAKTPSITIPTPFAPTNTSIPTATALDRTFWQLYTVCNQSQPAAFQIASGVIAAEANP